MNQSNPQSTIIEEQRILLAQTLLFHRSNNLVFNGFKQLKVKMSIEIRDINNFSIGGKAKKGEMIKTHIGNFANIEFVSENDVRFDRGLDYINEAIEKVKTGISGETIRVNKKVFDYF